MPVTVNVPPTETIFAAVPIPRLTTVDPSICSSSTPRVKLEKYPSLNLLSVDPILAPLSVDANKLPVYVETPATVIPSSNVACSSTFN